MKKILFTIKFFLKLRINFNLKSNPDYLILDDVGSEKLNNILNNSRLILPIRFFDNTKVIFINYEIIKYFFQYYFLKKQKPFTSYLLSTIKFINPKVVVTFIDNSLKFGDLAKILHKKYPFIAVQQCARYDFKRHRYEYRKKIRKENLLKKFFIPNLLCFGKYEKDDYKKYGIKVKKFFEVGSLSLANAYFYFKKQNIKIKKNKYDFCVASDDGIGLNETYQRNDLERRYCLTTKYTIQYCMKFKKKFVFAWKRELKEYIDKEYSYYKKHLSESEFKYLLKNSVYRSRKKFSSYRAILESNVVVGVATTMLREKLASGGKILSCNFTNLNVYDFPINNFFSMKKNNYSLFEKKIQLVSKMSDKEFNKRLGNKKNYLVSATDAKNINLIKNKIKYIKLNHNSV